MGQRRRKRPQESVYQALVQRYVSKRFDCVTVRELNFGGPKFDVVGFSPDLGEFLIVECKRTTRPVGVGQTFGQILAYKAMITDAGEKFLNSFNTALVKKGITRIQFWQYGIQFVDAGKIPVRFFVALPEEACERVDILQSIKKDLAGVGIIRINRYNKCRDYIHLFGDKDYEICNAARVEVPIAMPIRAPIRAILERCKADRQVALMTGTFDHKVMRMRSGRIRSAVHGGRSAYYRLRLNFVGLHPKQHYLRVNVKERSGWKATTARTIGQVKRLLSRAKKALDRTIQR